MKKLTALLFIICSSAFAQLNFKQLNECTVKYHLGSSTYFDAFMDHPGYAAHLILTADSGAAVFGDGDVELGSGAAAYLIKVDKNCKEQWRTHFKKQFSEMESQVVIQDAKGNYYAFALSYNPKGYRGGAERIVCFDKKGKQLWDKTCGKYELLNQPTFSYIKAETGGKIYLRGHIVTEKPVEGKDPVYHYYEGWLDSTGKLTQKVGDVIDWKNEEWQKKFKPE